MVSGPVACIAASTAGVGRGGQQVGEARGGAAFQRALGQHHFHIGRHDGGDCPPVARCVAGVDHARRQRAQHVAQLVVVLADGGIGRRGRAVRDAGVKAAERQQGVLQAVLAQDGDRAFGSEPAIQQGLADAASRVQRLAPGDAAPLAGAAVGVARAARHEDAPRLGLGPMQQAVGHAPRVGLQRLLGAQVAHSVGAFAQDGAGDAEAHGTVPGGGLAHAQPLLTLAARPSRKSRTRCLASGALWAMAAIRASVRKPWSAGCSAMRGSACIKA